MACEWSSGSHLSGVAGLGLASFARSSSIRAEASIATLVPLLLARPREALHAYQSVTQPSRSGGRKNGRTESRVSSKLSRRPAADARAPVRASSALTGRGLGLCAPRRLAGVFSKRGGEARR